MSGSSGQRWVSDPTGFPAPSSEAGPAVDARPAVAEVDPRSRPIPAETAPGEPAPPRDRPARRWASPAGYAAAAVVLFLCYLRISGTQAVTSDGASIALQAWDMMHGNWLLSGWKLADVTFYTTEIPEYILVELLRGLGPADVHVSRRDHLHAAGAAGGAAGEGQEDRPRGPHPGADRVRDHDRAADRPGRVPAAAVARPHRHRGAAAADLPGARPRAAPPVGAAAGGADAGLGRGRRRSRDHHRRRPDRAGLPGPRVPGHRDAARAVARAARSSSGWRPPRSSRSA